MLVSLISTDKIVYQDDFLSITLPSLMGEISVLPRHAPLITSLKDGRIKIKDKKEKEFFFEIERGVLEVNPKEVNILITLKQQ